ncbi:MAG: PP0621 family protein [Gallionella sp.]|nr:PP0621 family protein [Gallionella sp.]
MSRLFLLFAIAVAVYLLVRSFRRNASGKNMPGQDETIAEDMVRCAHCGVHLPKGESVQADGKFFCGAEHRDASLK